MPTASIQNLIFAADLKDPHELFSIVRKPDFPANLAIKLRRGYFESMSTKGSSISALQCSGHQVFVDAKIGGIQDECLETAAIYLKEKPWMLDILAGDASDETLQRFAEECRKVGTNPCAVTVLTDISEGACLKRYGRPAVDQVLYYAEKLIKFGVTHMVCSAHEAAAVRVRFGSAIKIVTPAIRLPGSDRNDQARVMTPHDAIVAGADFLVIGHDLTKNGTYAENYAKILANIEGTV
ncbi:orotidine 5'-phosphate decarboxylase [Candidatus Saccharibacteria bacterium]|nr:orotidine 5'-phosphate decarboxylase [Candidatus Saccharibacteria bacterium]